MAKHNKKHKFFAVSATAALVASAIVPVASAAAFSDQNQIADWAKEYVEYVVDNKLMKGNADGTFAPNATFTRAQAAQVIVNYLGLDTENTEAAFADVKEGSWYYGVVNAVAAEGLVDGVGGGNFAPEQPLTRQDAAKLFGEVLGLDAESADLSSLDQFNDANKIAGYAAGYIALFVDADVINGKGEGFDPTGLITRQELAKIVALAVQQFKDEEPGSVEVESAIAVNETTIGVSFSDGTYVEFELEEPLVEGENEVTFEHEGVEYTVTVEYTAAEELVVESVTAVNGTITVTLEEASKEVYVENFTVTQAINGGEAKEVTPSKAELSEDGKTVTLTVDKVAQTDAKQSVVYTVNGVAAKAFEVEAVVKELKVESVSAINAKQIQVKFNQQVDKDTALDAGNYLYNLNTTGATPVALTAGSGSGQVTLSLSDDKTTVTITASTLTENIEDVLGITTAGTPFQFIVEDVKSAAGKALEKATFDLSVKDTVAPSLVSASASAAASTKKVILEFNEPVDFSTTGVFKVNGKVVAASAGSKPNQVVLTTVDSLLAGSTNTVEILNLKDYAGNLIATNPTTTSFTVAGDTTAANVTSVTALEDDKIKVVFDKAMDTTSVSTTTVSVLNANGVAVTPYTVNVVPNTGAKEFTIDFGSGANLYANSNTELVNIFFTNSIKDSAGNPIAAVTKSASLTKDTVAPTVQNVALVAKGDSYDNVPYSNGALIVTFSEDVKDPGVTIAAGSGIKIIDQDGKDLGAASEFTLGDPILDSKNSKVLVIPFATNTITSSSKTGTVIVSDGITTDNSLGNNKNTAATFSNVNLQVSTSDKTKPVISALTGVPGVDNKITFTVTETGGLDKTTVQDITNYRLDGKPLESGSYVTIVDAGSGVYNVTVHLPKGSAADTRANYALTISGIKDLAGNTADVVAVNNISLKDTVDPKLVSGALNADGTIALTYSEAVSSVAAADLVVTLNGKIVSTTSITPSHPSTGSDAGKTLLTIALGYDAGSGSAGDGDETIYIDVQGGTDSALDAGDIVIAKGTYASLAAYSNTLLATDVITLNVSTAPTGTLTGADADGNKLVNGTQIKVK